MMEQGADLFPETESFLNAFMGASALELTQTLVPMEKYKRDKFIPILEQWQTLLQQALIARNGGNALLPQAQKLAATRESQDLLTALRSVQKGIDYAKGNISPAAISGWLTWTLR